MSKIRIALANVPFPTSRDQSLQIVLKAMDDAAAGSAEIVCFPECIVPGYRIGSAATPIDAQWLESAWSAIDAKAAELAIHVVLGTERIEGSQLLISARVTAADGTCAGFQDKVQLDPSEEANYTAGNCRKIFQAGRLRFGIVICHEGWRYPETVRWAARNGAHVVFHPHVELVENPDYRPEHFADPENSFHEKAALCRAAENSCYFATVNCAMRGSSTTSAIVDPDGKLQSHQAYGESGILFGEVDTSRATGFLAGRLRPESLA